MRDICFIDKTFDRTQAGNYHLSVQISSDGIFFAILDLIKGKYISLIGYNYFLKRPNFILKQVKEIFKKEEIFKPEYKSVEILYATNLFTLIPDAFYSNEDFSGFINFNHLPEHGFVIKANHFELTGAWCIFLMPENLNLYLEEQFPKSNIRHNLYSLIECGLKGTINNSLRKQIHLNFFRDNFEIAVIDGSKLLQCNIFNFKNERDILFYVLYVFDQLKLPPEDSEIIIHGHLSQISPVYHLLKKYIRKISFAKPNTDFQLSYTFNQLPDHYFTSLLNSYKCE